MSETHGWRAFTEDPAWHDRLSDTAIEELRQGKAVFGTE